MRPTATCTKKRARRAVFPRALHRHADAPLHLQAKSSPARSAHGGPPVRASALYLAAEATRRRRRQQKRGLNAHFAVVCPIGSTTSLPSSLARAHTHTLSLRSGLAQPSLPTHTPRPRFRWLPSSRERCWLLVAVWGQHAFGTRTAHFYTIIYLP